MPKILIEITEQDFNFLKRQVSLGWSQPIEKIIVEDGIVLDDCNPENCISRDEVEDLIYDALLKCHIEPNHAYYVTKKILKENKETEANN